MQLFSQKLHLINRESLEQVLTDCKKGDRRAQKAVYDMLAPKMLALCLRYMGERPLAEDVLQETVIAKFRKNPAKRKEVLISTTPGNGNFAARTEFSAPYADVVTGKDDYVFLATNEDELSVLRRLNRFGHTLPDIGIRMKTGLTVDFRNRDLIRDAPTPASVPLFQSWHIKDGKVLFPSGRESEYIDPLRNGLVQRNEICYMEIFTEFFRKNEKDRNTEEKRVVKQMMATIDKWQWIANDRKFFGRFKQQRYWKRR